MEARSSPRGRLEVQITAGATFMLPSSLPRCSATDTARGRGAALHSPHSGRRPEGQRVPRARLPRGWQQQEGAAPDSHMGAADLRKQVPRPRSAGHRSHTRIWPRAGAGSERSLGKNPNSRHLTLGAPRTVRDTEKGFLRVQAQGRTSLGRAHTRFAATAVCLQRLETPLCARAGHPVPPASSKAQPDDSHFLHRTFSFWKSGTQSPVPRFQGFCLLTQALSLEQLVPCPRPLQHTRSHAPGPGRAVRQDVREPRAWQHGCQAGGTAGTARLPASLRP